ncbi:MAG: ribbon-helix-helix domain-containing protein [Pseudomonadota bacterium]
MCKLFIQAEPELWRSSTRSIRIDGVVTSIRLETFFWMTLEEVADRDDLSVAQLITRLYLEAIDAEHDLGNFTSFLRVCCSRYLSLVADGRLERDVHAPLSEIDASRVLEVEASDSAKRFGVIALRRQSSDTVN